MRSDHRTQSAARKRERMRMRLLEATMLVCAEFGTKPIVIEDILKAAGVSRSTFYAHFDSLYAAMRALGEHLAVDLYKGLAVFYHDLEDPLLRIAVGFQAALTRASLQPVWGRAFASTIEFSVLALAQIRSDLARGREEGEFQFEDVDAALDVHVGAMIHTAKKIEARREHLEIYMREAGRADLRALGVSELRVADAVRWASEDLKSRFVAGSIWPAVSF